MHHAWAAPASYEDERAAERARHIAVVGALALGTDLLTGRVLPRDLQLPDARTTFLLFEGATTPRAVAQLACATAPDMVESAVDRSRAVHEALEAASAAPILLPFATGRIDGLSYAIWPWCRPLAGTTGSYLERRRLAGPLFAWLEDVTQQTVRPATISELDARFAAPLCRMATNRALRPPVRVAARSALAALDRGAWRPSLVAMHGDLHTGNVLLDAEDATHRPRVAAAERFTLIDWGGARLDGHAVYDWVRLAHSLRADAALRAQRLASYCDRLGCAPTQAPWYLAAAFAELGDQLGYFPIDRYARLADLSFSLLAAAGGSLAW